jgi:hypothetical protein
MPWIAIGIPFARSIVARRPNAPSRLGLYLVEPGHQMRPNGALVQRDARFDLIEKRRPAT